MPTILAAIDVVTNAFLNLFTYEFYSLGSSWLVTVWYVDWCDRHASPPRARAATSSVRRDHRPAGARRALGALMIPGKQGLAAISAERAPEGYVGRFRGCDQRYSKP